MRFSHKMTGGVLLALAALASGGALDVIFNEARLLKVITGRSNLEAMCVPELRKGLADRGFSPVDIEVSSQAKDTFVFWRRSNLAAHFSFQDGPEERRVDGIMACILESDEVHVNFRTSTPPIRAT